MTKEEYSKVLFDLGILDDDEDWGLFQLQEERFDIDIESWRKYVLMPNY